MTRRKKPAHGPGLTEPGERMCPWRPDQTCPFRPIGEDEEIVRLIALGWTDHRIGRQVGMATASISHRVARMAHNLGLEPAETGSSGLRIRLAIWASAHGLGPTDGEGRAYRRRAGDETPEEGA